MNSAPAPSGTIQDTVSLREWGSFDWGKEIKYRVNPSCLNSNVSSALLGGRAKQDDVLVEHYTQKENVILLSAGGHGIPTQAAPGGISHPEPQLPSLTSSPYASPEPVAVAMVGSNKLGGPPTL